MSAVIAIDGTFASGKGTVGKRVAEHYGFGYLDTGKLYRAVAHAMLTAGADLTDAGQAAEAAKTLDPKSLSNPALKSGDVGAAASKIAVHTPVRAALLKFQRDFAAAPAGAVLDGRDIGTVICPDADVKLYVDARPLVRAERRYKELSGYGEDTSLDTVLAQLRERDHRDKSRAQAPLKAADDAHLLDTSDLDIEAAVNAAVAIINAVLAR